MDSKAQELYNEEQRQALIDLNANVKKLFDVLEEQKNAYVAPTPNVKVTGEVLVNTEKNVTVENMSDIQGWLEQFAITIGEAIERSSHKPLDTITVSNITDGKPDSIQVSNLPDIAKYISELTTAIKENQPIVKVTKQDVVFPTDPKKAIAVRLSDGKAFYKAVFQAISSAQSKVEDPLAGYQITDQASVGSIKYYGYANNRGGWYIMRESSGAYRYAKGEPMQSGGGLYTDAWIDKANLSYDYIFEVFK